MLLKIDDRCPHPFRFMGLLESISPSALYELKVKNCFVGIPNNPCFAKLLFISEFHWDDLVGSFSRRWG